ncbi:2OG-Fe(II) oxygenase [Vampirovibrio chlorellavorus]|uniref:2OG-Fe(II) oxygenase n=1 Tax=Vampirovibrio chlorellavorus TaxID=758823 RepID=UPI0026EE8F6E|nr:2OG-Fe(II) oxygenase [Vampirovibrio chlorellavorus]
MFDIVELSVQPRILTLPNFLSDEECAHLIERARPKIAPSTTVDPETGEFILVEARSSTSTYFMIRETPTITGIEDRIALLLGLPVENGEGLQVLNYSVGQEYRPHFDFFDPNLKGSATVMASGGQRVATCILYLNDVEEGGETHFPELDIRVRPQKGSALLFINVTQEGEVDRKTLHASLPVIAGEKWISTKWVREREYK